MNLAGDMIINSLEEKLEYERKRGQELRLLVLELHDALKALRDHMDESISVSDLDAIDAILKKV